MCLWLAGRGEGWSRGRVPKILSLSILAWVLQSLGKVSKHMSCARLRGHPLGHWGQIPNGTYISREHRGLVEGSEGRCNNQKPMLSGCCTVTGTVQWISPIWSHLPTPWMHWPMEVITFHFTVEALSQCTFCICAFLLPQWVAAVAAPISASQSKNDTEQHPSWPATDMEMNCYESLRYGDCYSIVPPTCCLLEPFWTMPSHFPHVLPCKGNGLLHSDYRLTCPCSDLPVMIWDEVPKVPKT